NTNLSVAISADRYISNTRTNIDYSIRFVATVFGVLYLDTLRIDRKGGLNSQHGTAVVFRPRSNRLDPTRVLDHIDPLLISSSQHLDRSLMRGAKLWDGNIVNLIALVFENGNR